VVTFGQARLASGAGSVWAFAKREDPVDADAVIRIDPATNSVVDTIVLGHPLGTMAFGFDALWVSSPADGLLLRLDPATDEVDSVVEGLPGPFQVTVGPDSLWVSLHGICSEHQPCPTPSDGEPTLVRIDPATGETIASIAIEPIGITGGVFADETAVWVRGPNAFLTRIDPATNEVVEVITASKGGGDVVAGFGSVWTAGFDFHQVWRVSLSP
jgi:streptogramin lyase